jgi:serine beta-lactamase-like protein LACTB
MSIHRPSPSWLSPLLLASLAWAQEPEWAPAAVTAIEAQIARAAIPGLSCVVGVGDRLVFRRGFGFADLENDVAATAATVYRLASISKPITAVAVMQLAEAGQLDLDADVATLVPEWPAKQWPVTTRQLLAHLGGVRHYLKEPESTHHYATQTAALPRFASDALLHEPGTKYHYSTYGYNLAAAVVEARAGKPFAAVVAERIAGPSQAPTLQDDDVRRLIRGRAQGYVRRDGVLANSELMDGSYKLGGGGLCASAEDLVRFGQALLVGKLVKPATLAAMWTPQQTRDGKSIVYGLGFRVGTVNGRPAVWHSGAQSRVSTMFLVVPEPRVVVAVLCNLERVGLQPLAERLAELAAPPAGGK